eukprot:PhF_6_TR5637/c0_g1_i1/m.8217
MHSVERATQSKQRWRLHDQSGNTLPNTKKPFWYGFATQPKHSKSVSNRNKKISAELSQTKREMASLIRERDAAMVEVSRMQSANDAIQQRLTESMNQLEQHANQSQEFQREFMKLRDQLSQKKELEMLVVQLDTAIATQREELTRNHGTTTNLTSLLNEANMNLRERDEKILMLEEKIRSQQASHEALQLKLQTELSHANGVISKCKIQIDNLETDKASLELDISKSKASQDTQRQQLEESFSFVREKDELLSQLRSERAETSRQLQETKDEFIALQAECATWKMRAIESERNIMEITAQRGVNEMQSTKHQSLIIELRQQAQELETTCEKQRKEISECRSKLSAADQMAADAAMQLQTKSYTLSQVQQELRDLQANHDAELSELRSSLANLKKSLHTQRLAAQEVEQQRDVALQEITKLKSLRDQQRGTLEDFQETIRAKETSVLSMRKELQDLRGQLEESNAAASSFELQLARGTTLVNELRSQLQDAEALAEKQRKEITEGRAKLVALDTQLSEAVLTAQSKTIQFQQLQSENKELHSKTEAEISNLNALLTKAQMQVSTVKTELEDSERTRERMQQEIQELKGRIKVFESTQDHTAENVRNLEAKLLQARRQAQDLRVSQQESEQQRDAALQESAKQKNVVFSSSSSTGRSFRQCEAERKHNYSTQKGNH